MIERRELFRILAAGAIASQLQASHSHSEPPFSIDNYEPRFLSAPQYKLVSRLCNILLPPDEKCPGAAEAGVPFYIDITLLYSEKETQAIWKQGLQTIDKAADVLANRPFVDCSVAQQEQIVASLLARETEPQSNAEHFFVGLKQKVIEGFCLSDVGARQCFGYRGNTMLTGFPGCTHPEHQR